MLGHERAGRFDLIGHDRVYLETARGLRSLAGQHVRGPGDLIDNLPHPDRSAGCAHPSFGFAKGAGRMGRTSNRVELDPGRG